MFLGTHVEVRGHLCGVASLLPLLCGFLESRGPTLMQQVLLPASCLADPPLHFFFRQGLTLILPSSFLSPPVAEITGIHMPRSSTSNL